MLALALSSLASCALKPFVKEGWLRSRYDVSFAKPLFAICHATYCGACTGIPELAEEFANGEGDRPDCDVSLVSCDGEGCSTFPVKATPNVVMVVGTEWHDWKVSSVRTIANWTKFIDKYLKANVTKIENEREFEEEIEKTNRDGGAVIEVVLPSEDHKLKTRMNKLTKYYAIAGTEFRYRVDPDVRKPRVLSHRGPTCTNELTGMFEPMSTFLEKNKRSLNWDMSLEQWKKVASKRKTAVLITSEEQPSNFDHMEVPQELCNDAVFGYISTSKVSDILKITGIESFELPGVLVTDVRRKCAWFGGAVYNGTEECEERFAELLEKELGSSLDGDAGLPFGLKLETHMLIAMVVVCALVAIVITVLVSRDTTPKRKQE